MIFFSLFGEVGLSIRDLGRELHGEVGSSSSIFVWDKGGYLVLKSITSLSRGGGSECDLLGKK